MKPRVAAQDYHVIAKLLHWLIALLVIGLCVVGLSMDDLPNSPQKIKIYALHKSMGLSVLALMLARIGWRVYAGAPAPLPAPAWQQRAAAFVHHAMYVLLLWMPITGWVMNSAAGYPLRWFNWLRIPAIADKDPGLKELAVSLHSAGFWLLAALFALHVGAALKHHVVDRDDTLRRMGFGRNRTGRAP